MNTKELLKDISNEVMVHGQNYPDLWAELPDFVSGQEWRGEISDMAQALSEYDLTEDNLDEVSHELGNGAVEDYYKNIADRFHELSLWAYNELDEEVGDYVVNGASANDVMKLYLFCALRGLAYKVGEYALKNATEL